MLQQEKDPVQLSMVTVNPEEQEITLLGEDGLDVSKVEIITILSNKGVVVIPTSEIIVKTPVDWQKEEYELKYDFPLTFFQLEQEYKNQVVKILFGSAKQMFDSILSRKMLVFAEYPGCKKLIIIMKGMPKINAKVPDENGSLVVVTASAEYMIAVWR